MKKIFQLSILFLAFFLCSFITQAQSTQGFNITGHLKGLKDGEVIVLGNRNKDWHNFARTDSCVISGGNFHFENIAIEEGPRLFELYVFSHYGEKGRNLEVNLFLDDGDKVIIEGNVESEKNQEIIVTGSPANQAFRNTTPLFWYYDNGIAVVNKRLQAIQDSIGYDPQLVRQQVEAKIHIDRHIDSVIHSLSPSVMLSVPQMLDDIWFNDGCYHAFFLKSLYDGLSEHLKESYYGKNMAKMAAMAIGQIFPAFNLKTPDGSSLNSNDYVKKGKITIVHFWATNSFNVNKYQTELRRLYPKYHAKGLNIIGVSADKSFDDWSALASSFPWSNVIAEPRGWKEGSLVNDRYLEGGHHIPNTTNVLLDSNGTILAWDVSGPELHYYLDKYLSN